VVAKKLKGHKPEFSSGGWTTLFWGDWGKGKGTRRAKRRGGGGILKKFGIGD